MVWIEIVTVLALLQYLFFGALVGRARYRYDVMAPAITGHEAFERLYRVQMNTLEQLIAFLPGLWLAAHYWSPAWMAAVGAFFLVGRQMYLQSYTRTPAKRSLGYALSFFPTVLLLLAGLAGAVMAAVK